LAGAARDEIIEGFERYSDRTSSRGHFFHHEHFNRFAAGNQFKAELLEEGLFQSVVLWIASTAFIPSEVNVKMLRKSRLIHNRPVKVISQKPGDARMPVTVAG
jgi:hypothetical protein